MWKRARWVLLGITLVVLLSPQAAVAAVDALIGLLSVLRPFAPYATALVAAGAASVALRGLLQRRLADDRQEWWKRAEYAITLALDRHDDATASTGMELLTHLRADLTATPEDAQMLENVVNALINGVTSRPVQEAVNVTATGPDARGRPSTVGRLMARLTCREKVNRS